GTAPRPVARSPPGRSGHGGDARVRDRGRHLSRPARRHLVPRHQRHPLGAQARLPMFRWYVINTYSGHENKVKQNLEHRVSSLNKKRAVRRVVVPTESVSEMKDGQKIDVEKRTMPGYVLVN